MNRCTFTIKFSMLAINSIANIMNFFKKHSSLLFDLLLLCILFLLVFLVWRYMSEWIDININGTSETETDAQARGLFGDKFGSINSLFSGFAFAAISFTIYLQRRDMNHTVKAFEEQTRSDQKQRFDSTFFQLIALHNDITAKLRNSTDEGRKAFSSFNKSLLHSDPDFVPFMALAKLTKDEIRTIRDNKIVSNELYPALDTAEAENLTITINNGLKAFDSFLDSDLRMHEEKVKASYTKVATFEIDFFSHYFRNLYHILVFIDTSNLIDDKERKRYAKIVRSQLSEEELVALFYNSLTKISLPGREEMELGYPKMGKLLHQYDILQNMSPRSQFHRGHKDIFKNNNHIIEVIQ